MELFSVLITGANRGIGLEFTRQFLRLADPPKYVFATYRNPNGIQELQSLRDSAPAGTVITLIRMDVRDMSQIKAMKNVVEEKVGKNGLTLLINNAGFLELQAFPNVTVEMLSSHFGINAVGPILIAQEFYPLLKTAALREDLPGMSFSKAGILNISSIGGSIANTGAFLNHDLPVIGYKISKAALNMGMRVLGAKAKEDGILIINMCPGWVRTDMANAVVSKMELNLINPGLLRIGKDQTLTVQEPEESVATMLETIPKLTEEDHGMYIDRFGCPIPW